MDDPRARQTLSRDLSLFGVTMIGVGAMIGAGIFVLTGEAAGIAGPALILSFALNGIVTIFIAMVYAELGSAIPEAGGGYLWVKEGLPGSSSFLAGWMSWLAHAVAGSLYALGFGAFLFELLRILDVPTFGFTFQTGQKAFGLGITLLFAFINYRGASETGLAGSVITIAKLCAIGLFCFFGLKYMFFPELGFQYGAGGGTGFSKLQPFIPDETGWLGILSAMGLTFIAFEGYEIIVQAGEEIENPRRNIPKAIFWSLAIVVPIYMLVAFVLVGAPDSRLLLDAMQSSGLSIPAGISPDSENWRILRHVGELGLATAAGQFLPYGAILILVGGILSTMSALNATTFSSMRVAFAMGRDRNLPDHFSFISPKTRTPALALLWSAVLICFMVAFVPITTVAAVADIMFLLLFLQVNVAVMTIRKKYGDKLAYGYLMPFFPVVPVIGICAELALALFMFNHYPTAWLYAILWLGVGFAIFRFYAAEREREKGAPPVLLKEKALASRPRSVLVSIANPQTAKDNVEMGARIARRLDSELILLHGVRVPLQLPQRAAQRFLREGRDVLDECRRYAEPFEVPVSSVLRTGHDISKVVLHTAKDENTDFLIMGWKGPRRRREAQIGRNIDRVLIESNCHAIVMGATRGKPARKALVPIANPHTAALALAVGSLLVEDVSSGRVTVLHVSEAELGEAEKEEFRRQLEPDDGERPGGVHSLFDESTRFSLEFAAAGDPVKEIVRRSGSFDRLILGSSRGGFFGRKVFGRLPTEIARRAKCPVILVRSRETTVTFEVQTFFEFFRNLEAKGSGGSVSKGK